MTFRACSLHEPPRACSIKYPPRSYPRPDTFFPSFPSKYTFAIPPPHTHTMDPTIATPNINRINRPHTPPDDNFPAKTEYRTINPQDSLGLGNVPDYTTGARQDMQRSTLGGDAFPSDFPKMRSSANTSTGLSESTDHPVTHIATRLHRLLHWNNPLASSLALVGSLGLLIMTSYVSFFRLFCATATIAIGANLVYVNLMMQGQKLFAGTEGVNPHSRYIGSEPTISRSRVEHVIDYAIQLLNDIMQEATKIALIEDNSRSVRYLVSFYIGWTLATYIPINWLIGTALVTSFTGPMLYSQNKEAIDERLGQWHHTATVKVNDATATTKNQAQSLYDRARSFADQHGIPTPAGKVGATFKTDVPIAKKEE